VIGVIATPGDESVVAEFFELFKTPWEFCRDAGRHDVLLATSPTEIPNGVKLLVVYSRDPHALAADAHAAPAAGPAGTRFSFQGRPLPIYGPATLFPGGAPARLVEEKSRTPALAVRRHAGATIVRIGYDLIFEVRFLLTAGQPVANAAIPALDLHIALLREVIIEAGLPLVEIPPVPNGHAFVACLTHDIDHPVLRNHRLDHTTWGFLYRATLGTLIDACRGRKSVADVGRNFLAAARLPFVLLGLANDPWRQFDRYLEIEAGLGSTYFAIPFSRRPGRTADGTAPSARACRYELAEIRPQLDRAHSAGCEIGVHGLDAWLDADAGRTEREQVRQSTQTCPEGIRMHWLYFGIDSPAALEAAGYAYDSTSGYNATVGYRAGTAQVFRPLGSRQLLELPLHIMDTALFYPSYLHLRPADARKIVDAMIDHAERLGGVLTINWHDRSIAPERLWQEFHIETLRRLKAKGAWFPTAAEAVAWFRKRRAAQLECSEPEPGKLVVRAQAQSSEKSPSLIVRIHRPRHPDTTPALPRGGAPGYLDVQLDQNLAISLDL
jgi:hypothetical protein